MARRGICNYLPTCYHSNMSEALQTKRPYTSRWQTPSGEKLIVRPRDIEIFKLLLRYKYLPTKHIVAYLRSDLSTIQARLRQLRRAGYLYVEGAQRDHYKANYRDLVYSLDKKGLNELTNRRMECALPVADSGYAHQLLIDEVMFSFELGATEPFSFERLPRLESGIAVSITVNKKRIETHLFADGQPFFVRRKRATDQVAFLCPGIEADIGTEPIHTRDFERSSIRKKLALYLEAMEQGLTEKHFNRKTMYVPFITGTRARMLSMKNEVGRMAGDKSRFFIFKVHPNFHSQEDQRLPSGHMLTEDWEREGLPNFNFASS